MSTSNSSAVLRIGWAEVDITPQKLPVNIAGQFHVRVSEGILDPLNATMLALESAGEHVVFVSMDTVCISNELRDAVRERLNEDGLDPQKVIIHATHTHEAPLNRPSAMGTYRPEDEDEDVRLEMVPPLEYVNFAADRMAAAIAQAWQTRNEGGIAYGQDYAVIGRNRRWMDRNGVATMYGLNKDSADRFDYIEGYEDHSLNLLATYNENDELTGIVVNLPTPSQESESLFSISADFWHETRQELRERFGRNLFILPQCSAAGDLTSHLIFETAPHERMLKLRGRTSRQEIAIRIADCVGRILPYLPSTIERTPQLLHQHETVSLPMNRLTEADAEDARRNAEECEATYEAEKEKVRNEPELRNDPHWYVPYTQGVNLADWYRGVIERFETTQTNATLPVEIHVLKLGEVAFASNPFEYYLDFGIQIKVKSPALQNFLIQLAGIGTYIPSRRAAAGGGYGAVPASNPVGPEGGEVLADYTVDKIRELWATN